MLAEAIADMEATREFYQEHASNAVAAHRRRPGYWAKRG